MYLSMALEYFVGSSIELVVEDGEDESSTMNSFKGPGKFSRREFVVFVESILKANTRIGPRKCFFFFKEIYQKIFMRSQEYMTTNVKLDH